MSDNRSREEWLAWRRTGIGGSDAPIVAGVAPWGSRMELFLDKRGRLPERAPTPRMRLGAALEPLIAELSSRTHDASFCDEQRRVQSRDYPFVLATLDRVGYDGEVFELKAVFPGGRKDLPPSGAQDGIPEHWVIQGVHQAIAAEVESITFGALVLTEDHIIGIASLITEGCPMREIPDRITDLDHRTYQVWRNAKVADALIGMEEEFWSCVTKDRAPKDLMPQDAAALASAFRDCAGEVDLDWSDSQAAKIYESLGRQIREAEKLREIERARLLLSMGDAAIGRLPDGRTVRRNVIEMPERTVRAGTQVRLQIKD